ncbi:MAG: glycosyltransferase family 4 protein [Endomicrobiales bacterium]|nr:glycosyltransferase family 4 protein [Endomicrobiales bacterium]
MAKKILHVYTSWTAGGAEKLMLLLAEHLEKKGFSNVIACPGNSYIAKKAAELGLKVRHVSIKGSFDPVGFTQLAAAVSLEKIDIIHAHQGKVFWPCVFAKWLSGSRIKIIFHRHAQLPHAFYSRLHYRWADKVIAISKAVREGLVDRENVDKSKIEVVYNGTDFARFNPNVSGEAVRRKYGLGAGPVIGTAAAMNRPRGKGQEYLIEAAQMILERFPQARFLIVGTGEIEGELKALAKKLGVADKIIFTGYVEDVENYIAAMDVFCFLSWDTEGFGQVMVEAQGLGKPVIGTNIGGIPETFMDNSSGILIPPRNSEVLSQVILTLLNEPVQIKHMGECGIQFVTENFSIGKMTDEVAGIYDSF